jgi:short-subunit dehydrogenase
MPGGNIVQLNRRRVLLPGASTGIGREIALKMERAVTHQRRSVIAATMKA